MNRSLLFSSLIVLGALGSLAAGCSADADSGDDREAEGEDNLTAAATELVGSYGTRSPASAGFARLNLKADGTYQARIDATGRAVCVVAPCLLPEEGKWNASGKAGGGYRLRVRATGEPSRFYDTTKNGGLTLTRSGKTETLDALAANACFDDLDCNAGQKCGLYDKPDAGGVCFKPGDAPSGLSKEGEDCSGTSTGVQCEPGLKCGLYDRPEAGGVCFKP